MLTPNVAEYKRLAKAVLGDEKAPLPDLCQVATTPTAVNCTASLRGLYGADDHLAQRHILSVLSVPL